MYEGKISNLGAEIILLTQRHDTDKGKHSFKISKFCLSIKGFQIYAAETRIKLYTFKNYPPPPQGWIVYTFLKNDRFVLKTTKKKQKMKRSFLKMIVFHIKKQLFFKKTTVFQINDCFQERSVFVQKNIFFYKNFLFSKTIFFFQNEMILFRND